MTTYNTTDQGPASADILVAEITRIKSLVKPDSDIANMCGRAIAIAKHRFHIMKGLPAGRKTRVVLESPYAGETARNVDYARAALRDSLLRDEAPIASHLLHTQVLNDEDTDERRMGIRAGHDWIAQADLVVFYADLGCSNGMDEAKEEANRMGVRCETRYLGGEWAS